MTIFALNKANTIIDKNGDKNLYLKVLNKLLLIFNGMNY